MNRTFAIGHADVYVKSKDQERTRDCLQFLHKQFVTLVVEDLLVLPARDRMRRSRHDDEAVLPSEAGDDAAQTRDVGPRFLNVATNPRADFYHRLDHLGLDLLAEQHLALVENLGDVRTQLARLRINDLKLFFDAQCELIEHLSSFRHTFRFRDFATMRQSGLVLLMNSYRKCFQTLPSECTGL